MCNVLLFFFLDKINIKGTVGEGNPKNFRPFLNNLLNNNLKLLMTLTELSFSLRVLAKNHTLQNLQTGPTSPLTGSGITSDVHLLAVLLPDSRSCLQRSETFRARYCVAFYYIWMH